MNWLKKGTPYLPVTLAGNGVCAGAVDDRVQADRGEIDRVDAREAPAFAAPGGSDDGDDIGFGHLLSPL